MGILRVKRFCCDFLFDLKQTRKNKIPGPHLFALPPFTMSILVLKSLA